MSYKEIVMDGYPDPVTKEAFEKAEQLIGVRFPYPFYELVKDFNRGCPKDCEFQLKMPRDSRIRAAAIGGFLSFNPRNDGNIFEDYFDKAEHHPQDERFVPFAQTGNGDKFLFFYENGRDDPQPKVYYWAHEYWDIDGGLVFLANSFEEFLDMLKPDGYYDSL